jgi:endonuclease V
MKELWNIFKTEHPDTKVDFILIDGNGILHCNACGCASHFGVEIDVPTIGCGKTIFAVDGINKFLISDIKEQFKAKGIKKGYSVPLVGTSGRVWGHALKSGDTAIEPLIVSIGHRVSIETAVKVVNACCKTRVPEPIRFVDLKSRELIK